MVRKNFLKTGLVIGLLLATMPAIAAAEAKFLLNKQGFTAAGALKQTVTADFDGSGGKTVFAETKLLSPDRSALVLAVAENSGEAWALQLVDSASYVLYKTRLRDEVHEELVVLGLGREHGASVALKEVAVIGADDNGVIGLLPVSSFAAVDMLNAPLQQNTQRQILLPLSAESGRAPALLFWEPSKQAFRFALPK